MLIDSVRRIVNGERVFDPAIAGRIMRTTRGWQLQPEPAQPSVAARTSRELEVLKLRQHTGRCVTAQTRLMKKLRIHKITELTYVAIRDGLITIQIPRNQWPVRLREVEVLLQAHDIAAL